MCTGVYFNHVTDRKSQIAFYTKSAVDASSMHRRDLTVICKQQKRAMADFITRYSPKEWKTAALTLHGLKINSVRNNTGTLVNTCFVLHTFNLSNT